MPKQKLSVTDTLYELQCEAQRRAERCDRSNPQAAELRGYFQYAKTLAERTIFDGHTLYRGNPVRNTNDLNDVATYIMRDALLKANSPQGEKA